jgi:hypothetical protein
MSVMSRIGPEVAVSFLIHALAATMLRPLRVWFDSYSQPREERWHGRMPGSFEMGAPVSKEASPAS